jgi:DnaJ-class molecular chaperone
MKDYYGILGVPEGAGQEEIRRAFRKMAFRHHPDTSSEKDGGLRFKEINEAYCVIGDEAKRKQYDYARRSGFGGYGYSQQDIFRDSFSNQDLYDELNRMFAGTGLRFDADFLNQTFFSGRGIMFQFFRSPGMSSGYYAASRLAPEKAYRPGWLERMLGKALSWLTGFLLRRLLSVPAAETGLDFQADIAVTPEEADAGAEKEFTYQRNGQRKKLMVRIPRGAREGTKIRLRGMGKVSGGKSGDLLLRISLRG